MIMIVRTPARQSTAVPRTYLLEAPNIDLVAGSSPLILIITQRFRISGSQLSVYNKIMYLRLRRSAKLLVI